MKRTTGALVSLPLLALAREASACPACFGQADGPMLDAARVGIWLLLGVTLAMQGAFVAFFLYLRRQAARARSLSLDDEWSRLRGAWERAGRSGRA